MTTLFVSALFLTLNDAERTIWQPHPARGCETKHIMIPPGRMNVTKTSREETLAVCQDVCDRLWARSLGCQAVAIHTREWETQCLLCSKTHPDEENQPYSTFYSRDTEPDEGAAVADRRADYCGDCQQWVSYQERLCDKICSHNFIDNPTPYPTSATWGKWKKLTNRGIDYAGEKIAVGAEIAGEKIREGADYANDRFWEGVDSAHDKARGQMGEYYDKAQEFSKQAKDFSNSAYDKASYAYDRAGEVLGPAYEKTSDAVGERLDTLSKYSWPTPQPTKDPWALQRCLGCHADREEMINRCESKSCRISYSSAKYIKPELQFTGRPTNPPTPEPSKDPSEPPTPKPTYPPTDPSQAGGPMSSWFPSILRPDATAANLPCLECLRNTGKLLTDQQQGCYLSKDMCKGAPDKILTQASKCVSVCKGDE